VTLAAATKAGDFSRLFRAEFAYVWASLRRLGVRTADVEDVAHDVFMQVYAKFEAFEPGRPARPWLFGFAFRAASDYRRRARLRVEVLGSEHEPPDRAPLPEELLGRRQDSELVIEALETIELDRRAVLVAFELDETPMKAIAEALEIPLHTAYSRLRTAREEFAAAVRRGRLRRGES
jgi:RNA polymerase sigma-70 factor (ECF subfamily)